MMTYRRMTNHVDLSNGALKVVRFGGIRASLSVENKALKANLFCTFINDCRTSAVPPSHTFPSAGCQIIGRKSIFSSRALAKTDMKSACKSASLSEAFLVSPIGLQGSSLPARKLWSMFGPLACGKSPSLSAIPLLDTN